MEINVDEEEIGEKLGKKNIYKIAEFFNSFTMELKEEYGDPNCLTKSQYSLLINLLKGSSKEFLSELNEAINMENGDE